LDVEADIGDGWSLNSRFGHNAASGWMKYSQGYTPPDSLPALAERAPLSIMRLYVDYTGESFGFQVGLTPLSGRQNPILDIHYYPTIVGDIPFHRFHNNAVNSLYLWGKLGPGKLGARTILDNNVGQRVDGDPLGQDRFSIMLEYDLKILGFGLRPQLINSMAADSLAAPLSYGVNLQAPRFAGLIPRASLIWTSQTFEDSLTGTSAYKGRLLRVELVGKIGPGSLTLWHDWASVENQDFKYLWASYRIRIYRSDSGEVTVAPIYRLYTRVDDYSRARISLDFSLRFK
jgi:hypothetical protein